MNSRKIKFKYKDRTTLTLYVQVQIKVKNLAVFEERCNQKSDKNDLKTYIYTCIFYSYPTCKRTRRSITTK